MTDVDLLLGRVDADRFSIPVDRAAAEKRLVALLVDAGASSDRDGVLTGLARIADERMADAIRRVTIADGADPSSFALVAFGGAGGQHACAVAGELEITTVLFPAEASVLSAVGLECARLERVARTSILRRLDEVGNALSARIDEVADGARSELKAEGVAADDVEIAGVSLGLRLLGQETSIEIEGTFVGVEDVTRRFRSAYHARYGYTAPDLPLEVESIRVVAAERSRPAVADSGTRGTPRPRVAPRTTYACFDGGWRETGVHERIDLAADDLVGGPALVVGEMTTVVLPPGWVASVDASGGLLASRQTDPADERARAVVEVVQQELFTNALAAVAEQMGEQLRRTAISTNVRERLDYSCAVLDAAGRLVVNAPHMPVHVGAMGLCVRSVRERIVMGPDDCVVTNHPGYGGSHLPDVTTISPVHDEEGRLAGYVASRAHHAEIGGARPGSMPPDATSLADEGVVIPPMHVVRSGRSCVNDVAALLTAGPYPTRRLDDNLADLRAQVAANRYGVDAMRAVLRRFGADETHRRIGALSDRAGRLARRALADVPRGGAATQVLDDGTRLRVMLRDGADDSVIVDFTGTSGVHPGNLNATPAIVRSAVMYVLRLLVGERLPLNEGLMESVEVVLPEGILNPPFPSEPHDCPAVVGGNVETSQQIVSVLLRALDLCASSQGTMNNVLFGDATFAYYETVCGGAGAGPGWTGASAVHTHMTNTRITDPEILEIRYPVVLERFSIRTRSGGEGHWRGGDGVIRIYRFAAPLSVSLLTQQRRRGPFGGHGGSEGAVGRQWIERADGAIEELGSVASAEVTRGDRLVLQTPGGGGWGHPSM